MPKPEVDQIQEDIDSSKERAATLVRLLFTGALSLAAWQDSMEQEIVDQYIRSYQLGRGGIPAMTEADWNKVNDLVQAQYKYLAQFALEVGALSEAVAAARAGLYMQSAMQAYSTGQQQKIGGGALVLPAHPGDGSTACGVNCRCEWRIVERRDGGWNCAWDVDANAESCEDCLKRGSEWNPLVVMPQ